VPMPPMILAMGRSQKDEVRRMKCIKKRPLVHVSF